MHDFRVVEDMNKSIRFVIETTLQLQFEYSTLVSAIKGSNLSRVHSLLAPMLEGI